MKAQNEKKACSQAMFRFKWQVYHGLGVSVDELLFPLVPIQANF